MTTDDIRAAIAAIQANDGDSETQHSSEDALYIEVLKAIAADAPDAAELAREALKAADLDFDRWYA